MKRFLYLVMIAMPLTTLAQDVSIPLNTSTSNNSSIVKINESRGMKWVKGMSWEQIKEKAKIENKFIFLDCYTTWCGPCKLMDRNVFSADTVSNYFNKRFISVKVQIDKTPDDVDQIKNWYVDAEIIRKHYNIQVFPSFIFLSPQGSTTEIQSGFRDVDGFLKLAQAATKEGKVYKDPYAKYLILLDEYNKGLINYDELPFMIQTASGIDTAIRAKLMKTHLDHVCLLPLQERYTPQNIYFWSSLNLSSKKPIFNFFYKDGDKIDIVMNVKGFSAMVVDKTIQAEVVDSFFKMQEGETTIITGQKIKNSEVMSILMPIRADGKFEQDKIDRVEADWNKLKRMIRVEFNKECARRNVIKAKIRWYSQHQNKQETVKAQLLLYKKFPPDLRRAAPEINSFAWDAFLVIKDKKLLNRVLYWTKEAVQQCPTFHELLDTYANLLHKLNRTKEAIFWEEIASKIAPTDKDKKESLQSMKKGEPTYTSKGAIW